ncbi:IS66 family insertion sequence element accessory protein TnpB [Petrocella sp. FN5]|uniref:IS66 family insertion sequence element accessory protein TnpB n=1 Tax=Petrocella sp. FN5 TaxID=3032002 RepID=UPI003FA6B1C1
MGYKRLEAGSFQWPRSEDEAKAITQEQFEWLMKGMKIEQKKSIAKVTPLLPG